ncbi:uncharacterized protein K02A2.6-like [Sabethes cyaneus]|uniref:uncharacterized protein K02A2.6-like n=1 Tax=Sabethes cyaneus TaxID=53552 RepID=UPI00237DD1C3|nr:uncharacterized protein K02A2.6-like [Sabethes cyaneus]
MSFSQENGQPQLQDADRQRIQQHPGQVPQQQQQPPFVPPPHPQQQQQSTDNLFAQMMHMMQQQQAQYQQQLNQLLLRQQQNEQRSEERFQQSEERHQAFLRTITSSINVQVPPNPEQILDSLAGNIKEFHYEVESNLTFASWYSRYDDLFAKDAFRLDDPAKKMTLNYERDSSQKIEEKHDVTLEQLSEESQRLDNLRHDNAMIETASGFGQVNAVKRHFRKRENLATKTDTSDSKNGKNKPKSPCWFCGSFHYTRYCTFKSHKCSDCGIIGHREGFCASAKSRRSSKNRKKYTVSSKIVTVNVCGVETRRFVPVSFPGGETQLQLDTASDITVIDKNIWRKIGSPALVPATVKAKTASGSVLPLAGEFCCDITIGNKTRNAVIRVTDKQLQLLGSDLVDSFGLWSVPMDTFCRQVSSSPVPINSLKKTFPKLFSEKLGLCQKTKINLELKEQCKPVFCPKRPVAYAMLDTVNQELDRLEQLNIISPVDYSEWAAPIVVVRKANGSIRICGDYSTGLNAALQPHQYPLPLPEDIFAKLANCKVFSQIDLSDAFLQVEIDEASRGLLTVNTHRGLYHYNRLPPGVKIAPGAFQQLIDTMLAGLKGTSGYMDDVAVGGENEEEHDRNLKAVLQRIEDFGFTIRAEKCSFRKRQIQYLGHVIDQKGLRPDPSKIEAITKLSPPTDVSGVRSFLGAINYYGKFVPNMRMLRYPLDNLLKSEAKFEWNQDCQQTFDNFKRILSSDLLLTHYNPKLDIIVTADASSIGLGATISHIFPDGSVKVVQHASRALTKAEQNYSQPDREGLAIIFAVTKFHKMLFGRHFRLQTDHAPLLRIFGSKKGIPVYTANRLQRFALTLLLYDFEIEYVATNKFGNADVLSRLIDQHAKPEEDYVIASIRLEDDIRSVASCSANTLPLSFRVVAQGTQSDPLLRKVFRYIRDGWPQSQLIEPELKRFQARQESLSLVDGCILFGERLVIPSQYRKQCLKQLHLGHPGIHRMKALSRSYVYWPSLDEEVQAYVKTCPHCASVARSPPHMDPVPWAKASGPWQRVHVDFAGPVEGEYYLIAVDSFSKWPEVVQTRRITAHATISILRGLFARLGMPEILVSDNGTQFTSAQFADFCMSNGIEHVRTAPFHPQSNGQAERFVDTFKRTVKKIQEGRGDIEEALDIFLLTYRSTPNRSLPESKSPSKVMFGRQIRTCLELLRPPPVRKPEPKAIPDKQPRCFSKSDLVYAKVYTRNCWKWAPGVVCQRLGDVMYNVWIENHRMLRSHINQLRSRTVTDSVPSQSANPVSSCKQKLALDVLLEGWNLPEPGLASLASLPDPAAPVSEPAATQSSGTLQTSTPQQAVSSPRPDQPQNPVLSPLSSIQSPSTSTSTSSASTEFESAVEADPVERVPRRSSRNRRPPKWFDPYHLY